MTLNMNELELSLDEIKKHLNIDIDFTEDDVYLTHLCHVAEDVVFRHIDQPLDELKDTDGNLPDGIKHAMLLFIGNMYANREPVSYTNVYNIPFAYKYILDMYRNYDNAQI